jgi:hypothetical protein
MNRTYQINRLTALKRFEQLIAEKNPMVQLVFPLAEMLKYVKSGQSQLLIEVGRRFLEEILTKTSARRVCYHAGPHLDKNTPMLPTQVRLHQIRKSEPCGHN